VFENLRQVLIGALKPVVNDIDERAEQRAGAAPNRKSARKSA
jgi:hypothetical protein